MIDETPSRAGRSIRRPARDETVILPRFRRVADAETALLSRVPDDPETDAEPAEAPVRRPQPSLADAPAYLLLSAVGVAVVAISYYLGRTHSAYGDIAYWIGQLLVVGPIAARAVVRRSLPTGQAFVLAIGLAVEHYLLKWLYSPDQLRFPDELQHISATQIINDTGLLMQPNPALPVAASFPGLAEIGSAVSLLTGLPIPVCGMIIAGLGRLVFVAALFALILRATGRPRAALLACLAYSTSAHYLFFNAMFLYQAGALAFAMVSLWATYRLRQSASFGLTVIALGSAAATIVTHHVTGLFLCVALLGLGLAGLLSRERVKRPFAIALLTAMSAVAWVAFPARAVIAYFSAPLNRAVDGLRTALAGGATEHTAGYRAPLTETAIQAATLLILLGFVLVTARSMRREARQTAFTWLLLLASFSYFASSALRFLGAQGPEMAGRAGTFTFLPLAVLIALRSDQWLAQRPNLEGTGRRSVRRTRTSTPRRAVLVATFVLLLTVAARVGGWPPGWERLPGKDIVSGFESAVTPTRVHAAQWSRAWLGSGHRMGADITGWTLVSGYGHQDPVTEVSALWDTSTWTLADQAALSNHGVDFLWVDWHLTEQPPITGGLFLADPANGTRATPVPAANLEKFDTITSIRRAYDDGTIRIYDVRGLQ